MSTEPNGGTRRAWRAVAGIALVAIATGALPGCLFAAPEGLKTVSPRELAQRMREGDILLLDVHSPEQTHLPGTDYYMPFYRVARYRDRLPRDKHVPIYLYCKSGPMGNWAARSLFDLGYTNVYNLEGGSEAWIAAGLPHE